MDVQLFHEIGLTNAETKVYLALLKTGKTTAGPLLNETGLQNSTLHKTLHSLVAKGFASFIIKGKTKHYTAADPEHVLKFIKEKEAKFEAIMPQLKVLQKPIEKQEAEIYEGFKGFKTAMYEMIKDVKPKDEWLFFSFNTKDPESFKHVFNFYKEFDKDRVEKGLVIKGILNKNIEQFAHMEARKHAQMIVVDEHTISNVSICNDKIMFTPWEDKQISFLIHSRQLADSFRQYFYSIWKSAK